MNRSTVIALTGLVPATLYAAANPEWIWGEASSPPEPQVVFLRKVFVPPAEFWNARLTVAADDAAEVYLNGKQVAVCQSSESPVRAEVSVRLNHGQNVLGVRARNGAGPAGVLVHLNVGGSERKEIISDTSWRASDREEAGWATPGFDDSRWIPVVSRGAHGIAPWGDVLGRAVATPAESIVVPEGFKVELLRSAAPSEGSWICLTFDERGRLLISPEGDQPLLRLTLSDGSVSGVERMDGLQLTRAMGLLVAQGSLFANARGPEGPGLYRLTDRNGNDRFEPDELRLLKRFQGEGEHGYHALAAGPDGHLYVLNGNGTKLPSGISPRSPHRHYAEDVLSLNREETEPSGDLPAGYVLRADIEGREWALWAGGFRNAYDFDFNADGELFVFDSDMEWDWGAPWYRPTRVHHCVSGGEYGWRADTRLWPDGSPDAVPGVADIGLGSPTGVRFGTRSQFPAAYRKALFVADWSYGRILAVHLRPRGASYRGSVEPFLRGRPLNVTDLDFGPDGALYFITGGRGTQSGLYRVRYLGAVSEPAEESRSRSSDPATAARALCRRLEAFHSGPQESAVDAIWPHLSNRDPMIRYAARIGLEAQEPSRWQAQALAETNRTAALTALLALARTTGAETQASLFAALVRFPLDGLDEEHRLLKFRVIELSFLRQGPLASELARLTQEELTRQYPAPTWPQNRELSRLLLWMKAPEAVPRTLELLASAPALDQQLHYVGQLRRAKVGWTPELRRRYFSWWLQPRDGLPRGHELRGWFADVDREPVDGVWLDRYLNEFREQAVDAVPEDERPALKNLLTTPWVHAQLVAPNPRSFVKEWSLADFAVELDAPQKPRDSNRGRQAFANAQCAACHRLGSAGGTIGPDLTGAASRYSKRDLLEAILNPSKVIPDSWRDTVAILKTGEVVSGRVVRESDSEVVFEVNPLARHQQTFLRREIEELKPSATSSMPDSLVNVLTKEEVLDLLAWLESGGKSTDGQ